MADAPYSFHLSKLYEQLKGEYPNIAYSGVDFSKVDSHSKIIDAYENTSTGKTIKTVSRIIYELPEDEIQYLDEEDYDTLTQEYSLFHINTPEDPRLLQLSTKFGEITTIDSISYELTKDSFPSLMRRYRFMHMARNASTIGILVNTLSIQNTRKLLNKVIKWIRNAGKKHYMFVVGKPNVAKLANFESIEVWCVLGCPQGGIVIDNYNEYYRPIITPYELQMSLNYQVTWTGKWVLDFQEVMNQEGYASDGEDEETATEAKSGRGLNGAEDDSLEDDDIPEFNPVTGQLTSSKPLRQLQHLEIEMGKAEEQDEQDPDNKQLVKKFSSALTVKNTVSTAAYDLQNRAWTGLGSDFKEQDDNSDEDFSQGAEIEIGRSGIARDYGFK
ncbi:unnamed protein product [Ambrosiozyma monospora]|uniref:2-(3-amino-3-carboxypropyl)histidine synthase subunit 2 n=1 Tax=Ambrosiozyma monospora TaxID=43982 RepID=A0A9W6YVX7_AMBMO|nr:unnamed protein product [Ambrosiozyma monospora]